MEGKRKNIILAIDDNQDNLIILNALINDLFPDAIAFTALSGARGLELAASKNPDLILLDIVMPDMDGYEVCQKLKADENLCDIPVIFITALKDLKESRIRALEVGAEAFLSKPIDESELFAQIQAMLKIKNINSEKRNENARLAALVEERTHELNLAHDSTLKLLEVLRSENEARKKSEEIFRSVAQSANDAIITANHKGLIVEWNRGAEKIFGYSFEEVSGKELTVIIPLRLTEPHTNGILRIQHGGEKRVIGKTVEVSGLHKNGNEFPIELSLAQWETESGSFFTAIIRDITERKKTEQELLAAKERAEESDRLKSAFLANMSHEIRTPMNGILGFAGLLKEPGLSGEKLQKYIKIIEKSGIRMLNIINDIVDISKVEAGLMDIVVSQTNINEQIEFIYTFFKPETEQKGLDFSISTTLATKDVTLKTDREKIFAILTNLVKNAIKFCDKGAIELGYKIVETAYMPSLLQFYVKDTGIGIPIDRQKAIFERFIQADISDNRAFQGAGLGLSITKAYVEMLGGKIWVESIPGKGSTFFFTIPYNPVFEEFNDQKPGNITNEGDFPTDKLKVLIAEDDETSQILISMILESFGNEFIKVKTGAEAVEACRLNPDISIILMDIKMPEMDGYEATRQIRKFNKDVKIFAQTAFALSGEKEIAIKAGCNDYIAKPYNETLLGALIKKHFIYNNREAKTTVSSLP